MIELEKLFDVVYGHSLELNRLTKTTADEGIPFVSRKMGDNGVAAFVKQIPTLPPNPAGDLTCALSGNGVLTTHIQERPYYTAFHVACLRPKIAMTKQQLLYFCCCIQMNRYRYSYGRQANRTLKAILVPEILEIPPWVASVDLDLFENANAPAKKSQTDVALDTKAWRSFKLSSLFALRKGKRLTKAQMVMGDTPFIGAIDNSNGVSAYVGQSALHKANTLTVNYNGGVAETFYQPVPFRCSDDVNVLYPQFPFDAALGLFFATVIRLEKYRFNYGRKWHLERMAESEIRLPITRDGKPDFDFMRRYVQSLPFSSQI